MRLLIAEDDIRLLKSLKHIFERESYVVDGVSGGREAFDYAAGGDYDGIILDIMMPGMDGIEVLKRLRQRGIQTPVLFLTARTEVYQRVEGLDAGADDYLPKPFSAQELLARVRAMLRRKDSFIPDIINFGGVALNRSTYELSCGAGSAGLSGKEFQMMDMLMQAPRSIVTIDRMISHIWGWNAEVETSTVWVHISNLRKKLTLMGAPLEIRFIRNAGYVLEERK